MNKNTSSDSRRQFLETTAAGAIGLSSGIFTSSAIATETASSKTNQVSPGQLKVMSDKSIPKNSTSDLHLRFESKVPLKMGAKLWLFLDIRQGIKRSQTKDPGKANYLSITLADNGESVGKVKTRHIRSFDLLPELPEFLYTIELTIDKQVDAGQSLDFMIKRWTGPQQPIDPFRFWLVVDHGAVWDLFPMKYKSYRFFAERDGKKRVATEDLFAQMVVTALRVTGDYPAVLASNHRKTPGIFWGEFHGMVFNQRPLDDYYNYAKQVTKLDFCAPFFFSYNTCIGNVWDEVKEASRRHNKEGHFIAIAGFETGTPPEGSHRCILFRDPENIPPIFCEHRPPAQEAFFKQRFHPKTIICETVEELYETVTRYGGMITGHFHTRKYHAEVLCEMFQKNLTSPAREEQKLYDLLRAGKRFALAGTSDTHDSMPGNPLPEPHLPMAAGFTGVHSEELTTEALFDAVLARRIYATSGARIIMNFHSNKQPMGSELPLTAKRIFQIDIDGTNKLQTVELLRDGRPIQTWSPANTTFSITAKDTGYQKSKSSFYLVRVKQTDNHKGWTSPIWFG